MTRAAQTSQYTFIYNYRMYWPLCVYTLCTVRSPGHFVYWPLSATLRTEQVFKWILSGHSVSVQPQDIQGYRYRQNNCIFACATASVKEFGLCWCLCSFRKVVQPMPMQCLQPVRDKLSDIWACAKNLLVRAYAFCVFVKKEGFLWVSKRLHRLSTQPMQPMEPMRAQAERRFSLSEKTPSLSRKSAQPVRWPVRTCKNGGCFVYGYRLNGGLGRTRF